MEANSIPQVKSEPSQNRAPVEGAERAFVSSETQEELTLPVSKDVILVEAQLSKDQSRERRFAITSALREYFAG